MRQGFVPVYRARPSPLHAARAGVSAALCAALALVCALYKHSLVLLAAIEGVWPETSSISSFRDNPRGARALPTRPRIS